MADPKEKIIDMEPKGKVSWVTWLTLGIAGVALVIALIAVFYNPQPDIPDVSNYATFEALKDYAGKTHKHDLPENVVTETNLLDVLKERQKMMHGLAADSLERVEAEAAVVKKKTIRKKWF